MSDFKSKLPNLRELTHMAGKLFADVKNSVCEIIDEYKQKRTGEEQHQTTTSDVTSSNDATTTMHGTNASTGAQANPTPPITPVKTQTAQSTDELNSTNKKPTKNKQSTTQATPVEGNIATDINLETKQHIDEQKPLKDDVL